MKYNTARTWSSILGGLGVALIINNYIGNNEPHPDPAVNFAAGLIPLVMIGISFVIELYLWSQKK